MSDSKPQSPLSPLDGRAEAPEGQPAGFKPAGPVYFVLGGPGSGKGTNCERLVQEFGLSHYSAGDLLRAEAKKDTRLGKKITAILADGQIVPMEVTIALLCNAMAADPNPKGYLLDGFPRKMDQAMKFENEVVKAEKILYFALDEETMLNRIRARSAAQPASERRADDDEAIVRKRFQTNVKDCMPVIEKYRAEGRLAEIDAAGSKDEVYAKVQAIVAAPAKKQESCGCPVNSNMTKLVIAGAVVIGAIAAIKCLRK